MSNTNEQKFPTPPELLSPAAQAVQNSQISAAVSQTITSVFAQLGPVLERTALTPDKLREALKPWVDPAHVAREAREKQLMREDLEEARRTKELEQKRCTHKDLNMRWSICRISNYPDRNPRGVCVRCHRFFQPTHWEIVAPDAQHPRGKPVLVKADPDYAAVMADLAQYQNSI